jgi:NTE family protein
MSSDPRQHVDGALPRVALVLGGGGNAGLAYHIGVLLALEHDFGWDPRTADLIVGTSAGSIVAALLRAGLSTDDLAAWCVSAEPGTGREDVRGLLDRARGTSLPWRPSLRIPVPSPTTWWRMATGRLGVVPGLLAHTPLGLLDLAPAVAAFDEILDTWPAEPLWLVAVDTADGRRTVFGTDPDSAPRPASAIAASCAIPGLYRGVRIDGRHHLDGGLHSPTNADLIVGARAPRLDAAIVVSPMSASGRTVNWRGDHALRRRFGRRLDSELRTCRESGLAAWAVEPNAEVMSTMGLRLLDDERSRRVMTASFLGTAPQVDGEMAALLCRRAGRIARAEPARGG